MDIPSNKYRTQIEEAWADLHMFERIQRNITSNIDSLRELIRATANMLPDEERGTELMLLDIFKHPTNITEAVKVVLYVARLKAQRLTPVQVKETVEKRGFSLSTYSNPMASIHTILRRMKEANPPEVSFDENDGSYALEGAASAPDTAPEINEEIGRRTYERLAFAQPIDKDRFLATLNEISSEIMGERFSKILKKAGNTEE
jgi:hypothetical protein